MLSLSLAAAFFLGIHISVSGTSLRGAIALVLYAVFLGAHGWLLGVSPFAS